jgi:ATPase subunit of ABC transporter with duplicated ATPase domains
MFATKIWSMENGTIMQYDCGFEEYLEALRNQANTSQDAPKKKVKKPRQSEADAQTMPQKPISTETLIHEAEAKLKKLNAEIETDLSSADFSRMDELYKTKNRLEEQIETLYREWLGSDGQSAP